MKPPRIAKFQLRGSPQGLRATALFSLVLAAVLAAGLERLPIG